MTQPVEPEPSGPSMREIFGWRFWLNYVLCLGATVWIPLLSIQGVIDGKPQGKPHYVPMYEVYGNLVKHPGTAEYWLVAAGHLGIIFVVMALVWWIVLRRPMGNPDVAKTEHE